MQTLSHFLARFTLLRCLALLALMLGATSSVLAAKTYTINGDGTVTDPTTGLSWMRCSMGQKWDGATCTGSAAEYTWDKAAALTNNVAFAGRNDWRLPNIRELQSIVDVTKVNNAIDMLAFPMTPRSTTSSSFFWSTSLGAKDSSTAWTVEFSDGLVSRGSKIYSSFVRLVRGGEPFGLLDPSRPSTDYVDHEDGTASHTPTGLIWQRCALGQVWTGRTCEGTSSVFTRAEANLLTSDFAGKSDWRLPTIDELFSLVDFSNFKPTINTTLFPNTGTWYFRSSSPNAVDRDYVWYVDFYDGYSRRYGADSNEYLVRLVRAGRSGGPAVANADMVFSWAERTYPDFFSPANGASQSILGYRYRAYSRGGFLAVNDGTAPHLLYLGPLSGGAVLDLGLMSIWLTQAGP